MAEFISLDLKELRVSQAYGILISTIKPRPIAFVSTLGPDGTPNLAPFSFFNAGGSNPPSLVICPTLLSDGAPKDTLRNIEHNGEFVVNLVTRAMAERMNATSFDYPSEVSEWEVSGFEALPSDVVNPARVQESPVQYECRSVQVIRLGEGKSGTVYVIGEILRAHLDRELWDEDAGRFHSQSFLPIGRLGGGWYVDLAVPELFEMPRPTQGAEARVTAPG